MKVYWFGGLESEYLVMESLKQYEMEDDDEIPPWAITYFGKVSYSILFTEYNVQYSKLEIIFGYPFTDERRNMCRSSC